MEHEVLKLNSHCNCELEFNEILEAVVLVYKMTYNKLRKFNSKR